MTRRCVLIDIGHPAHYHLFKHAAREHEEGGGRVVFTIREKDVTKALMDHDGVPYVSTGPARKGWRLGEELLRRDLFLHRAIRQAEASLVLGVGNMMAAQAAWAARVPSVILNDTEHARLAQRTTLPFCTEYWTPDWYALDHGPKQRRYRGYHEAAYLWPGRFRPDGQRALAAGVRPDKPTVLVRTVGWHAHHDVGVGGRLSTAQWTQVVQALAEEAQVLVSAEGAMPEALESHRFAAHPSDMHHVLAACDLFVGEGATMASEAALLGVPAIYVNPLPVGNVARQVEAGLAWTTAEPAKDLPGILSAAKSMLRMPREAREQRRADLLAGCDDLTALILARMQSGASSDRRHQSKTSR